jgi:hypothetical protein
MILQVENLVAIELSYINTKHPDFEEARLIYRGLADDGFDNSDLRKVSMQNAIVAGSTGKQVIYWTSVPTIRMGLGETPPSNSDLDAKLSSSPQ